MEQRPLRNDSVDIWLNWQNKKENDQPCLAEAVARESVKRGGPPISMVVCPCPKCNPYKYKW